MNSKRQEKGSEDGSLIEKRRRKREIKTIKQTTRDEGTRKINVIEKRRR